MKKDDQRWTREQEILAFNLYCKIPFSKVVSNHPEIVLLAKAIGRTPNSVKMKIANFGSFDPELKKKGIVGLSNASRLDEEIWNEFNSNWEDLAYESEKALAYFEGRDISSNGLVEDDLISMVEGIEKERLVKTRVNQNFFRQTVLSAYDSTCCVTGINIPELLIASHIIPWSIGEKDRLNPRNGLCLNALHDKAFDRGLMTISLDFKIKVSPKILSTPNEPVKIWLASFDGKNIATPSKFAPQAEFIEYHNKNIFQS